uniref:Uncharacterized protein n=1 Tax=Panagrolaimus sp. JU765 TaxID=591449 RepID=A0AC34PUF4_9BILA
DLEVKLRFLASVRGVIFGEFITSTRWASIECSSIASSVASKNDKASIFRVLEVERDRGGNAGRFGVCGRSGWLGSGFGNG